MSSSLSTGEATSQTEPVTLYPFVLHSFKDSLSSTSFRAQVCTVAPSCANSSTIAYLCDEVQIITSDKLITRNNYYILLVQTFLTYEHKN